MNDYPMYGYLYTADGFHGPPVTLATPEDLHTFLRVYVPLALADRRELLIVSGEAEECVYHLRDGSFVYMSGADLAQMERTFRHAHAPRWCRHCGDALDPDDPGSGAGAGAPEAWDESLCVECYDVAHYEATGWLEEDPPCPR